MLGKIPVEIASILVAREPREHVFYIQQTSLHPCRVLDMEEWVRTVPWSQAASWVSPQVDLGQIMMPLPASVSSIINGAHDNA